MLPHDWFAEDFTCKDRAPFFLLHGDKMKRIGLLLFLIMPGRLLPEKAQERANSSSLALYA